MRVFMYVVATDSGFAPNPFHGWCTLACCKPAIRRTAAPGDWIVGVTPRKLNNELVYAMQVEEALTFEQYWSDRRFRRKRPPLQRNRDRVDRCGDNCYRPLGGGRFEQLRGSGHWNHEEQRENEYLKGKDVGGRHVLVGRVFSYFGGATRPFPPALSALRFPMRGHRVRFTETQKAALLRLIERLPRSVHGRPRRWNAEDTSWQQRRSPCG